MVRFPSALRDSRRPAGMISPRGGRRLLRRLVDENLALKRELEQLRSLSPALAVVGLGGPSNRDLFEQHLSGELSRSAHASDGRGSLLLIGINDFKAVNRLHGSAARDGVVRGVAEVLRSAIRSTDSYCRTGDGEFMVLLSETDSAAARLMISRVKAQVIRASSRGAVPFSVSIGVASWPVDGRQAAGLVHQADTALSAEKRHLRGRNRRRPAPGAPLVLVK